MYLEGPNHRSKVRVDLEDGGGERASLVASYLGALQLFEL